jgi:hypothetical protein
VTFAILAYWILMIPESSVLPFHHLAVDYRPYPGSVFVFLALACFAVNALGVRRGGFALALFAAYAGASSVALNRTWQNGRTLWSHSVAYGGDPVAHLNLALSLTDRHDPQVRRHLRRRCVSTPVTCSPTSTCACCRST